MTRVECLMHNCDYVIYSFMSVNTVMKSYCSALMQHVIVELASAH